MLRFAGSPPPITLKWRHYNPISDNQKVTQFFEFELQGQRTSWSIELSRLSGQRKTFLCFIRFHCRRRTITVERLQILVILNEFVIYHSHILDYPFSPETEYSFDFEAEMNDYDDATINNLNVNVRMEIKKERTSIRINDEGRSVLYGDKEDIFILIEKLKHCRLSYSYGATRMYSRENREFFVHLYILQVRWTNLFQHHNIEQEGDNLHVNISTSVLETILRYMYTGSIITNSELWETPSLITEIFQVIFRYGIFHMQEAISMYHPNLSQSTIANSDNRRISIKLHYAKEILIPHSISFPIHVSCWDENFRVSGVHIFRFTVHIKYEKLAGPWLSYSLLSHTGNPFEIHVSLEMVGNGNDTKFVHYREYLLTLNMKIESGPILFLGCPETFFGNLRMRNEIPTKLLFSLSFHNRPSNTGIWYLYHPEGVSVCPISVLQDHMYEILTKKFKADLTVETRGNDGDQEVTRHLIHKAIFDASVPRWWNAVRPKLPSGTPLPDLVILPMCARSFKRVAEYIYTGAMSYCPIQYQAEILKFGAEGFCKKLGGQFPNMRFPESNDHV